MKSAVKKEAVVKPPKIKSKPFWRDALEVLGTLLVILVVLRLLLGANMPVPLVAVVSCSMLHQDDVIGSVGYALAGSIGSFMLDSQCAYVDSANWRGWITEKIPGVDIESFPLKSGFSVGDMILVITPDGKGTVFPFFSETKVGDVVIYKRDNRATGGEPIIHRVVGIIKVENGNISKVEGTLDCFTEYEFQSRYIPYVTNCQQHTGVCQYANYPKGSEYSFYITKGDNNKVTDQCHYYQPILPVPDSQVIARGWIRIPYLGWLKMLLNSIMSFVLGVVSFVIGF